MNDNTTTKADGWCILRTSGAKTLPLATALADAGFRVWTPIAVTRQPVRRGATVVVAERTAPIAPTLVFGEADRLLDFAELSAQQFKACPGFSVFVSGGRAPLVGEVGLRGLRAAEEEAQIAIEAAREEVAREEKRLERAEALKTEKQRRKALRALSRDFDPGLQVAVRGMPAFAGLSGTIVRSRGKEALVAFGGSLVITIEAWQIIPHDIVSTQLSTA